MVLQIGSDRNGFSLSQLHFYTFFVDQPCLHHFSSFSFFLPSSLSLTHIMSELIIAPPRAPHAPFTTHAPSTAHAPSAVIERKHMAVYLSARPLLTTPTRMAWRHFTWFLFYFQLLLLDPDFHEFLDDYDTSDISPGVFHLFQMTHECLPYNTMWEALDMFESMLEPATPGQFILYAFTDCRQCLYYIAPLHFYYPWVDILVRDYTQATTQDGGFFKVIRLHMITTRWIVRPQIRGRIWFEYVLFRILYFFLRHWHTAPPLGKFQVQIRFNDVVDNIV